MLLYTHRQDPSSVCALRCRAFLIRLRIMCGNEQPLFVRRCCSDSCRPIPVLHKVRDLAQSLCTALQDFLIRLRIMRGNKQPFTILDNVSGVLKPVRQETPLKSIDPCRRCSQNACRLWPAS